MHINSFPRAILIDLAGVLYVGDKVVTGAVAALERLRHSGVPLRFLTNTTRTPCVLILQRLQAMGFDIVRVRHQGDTARIEVPTEEIAKLVSLRDEITKALKGFGFTYVSLDLEGFRSGSLNEALRS